MASNLTIKYSETEDDSVGYDLGLLGESFSGFNSLFKELFEASSMQGDFIMRTEKIVEGSIDVTNVIQVITTVPFREVRDFLDFLQVVDVNIYNQASNYFNTFGNAHKTVNDYFKENAFDLSLLFLLVPIFFTKMIHWSGLQKKNLTLVDDEGNQISERYAKKLKKIIQFGGYKKALKPLTENSIEKIEIASDQKYYHRILINDDNLGDFLPDEEKILPEFENGKTVDLAGEILALQSTRGESLRFKAYEIEPKYQLLVAYPLEGKKTEDYMEFYKKQVNIKAEIYRKSLFRKPEIIILEINIRQPELFEES